MAPSGEQTSHYSSLCQADLCVGRQSVWTQCQEVTRAEDNVHLQDGLFSLLMGDMGLETIELTMEQTEPTHLWARPRERSSNGKVVNMLKVIISLALVIPF